MGRKGRAIVGGLLAGLGQTFSERGRNRVDEERRRREDLFTLLRDEKAFDREKGLLSTTEVGEGGNVYGITRGGKKIDLDFKAAPNAPKGQLTDAQMQADAKARYTTESLEGDVVDWKGVDAYLAAQGRPDLAAPRGMTAPTSIDKTSDEWLSAEEDAVKWGKDQERFWSFDTTVFEEYGGETQAIRDKTMEYYLADKGLAGKAAGGTKQPARETKQPSGGTKTVASGSKPLGSGTEANPYRAASQADVDWFKANAAAGEFIEIDGKLYRQ